MGKNSDYDTHVKIVNINSLEHRRIEQCLSIFVKCFKKNGLYCIGNLFKPRVTPYNLRNSGVNMKLSPYNNKFFHGSFIYINISHIWIRLSAFVKNARDVASFGRHLKKQNFTGCQYNNCI